MKTMALIVLNYNDSNDTVNCVNQLLSFEMDLKIVIVDNCSDDNSYAVLKREFQGVSNIDLIRTPWNGGYSRGNNLGIKYALNKYAINIIGIVNPDVILPCKEILINLADRLFSNEKFAVIGASAIDGEGKFNPNYSAWNLPNPKELIWNQCILSKRYKKETTYKMVEAGLARVDCVAGCFLLAKAAILKEIGFFDENVFLYNEENILGFKIKQAGYQEVLAIDQFYYHNHKTRQDSNITLMKKLQTGGQSFKSRCYLCKTYYSKRYLPALYAVELINVCCFGLGRIRGNNSK